MVQIFISYSRANQDFAQQIANSLEHLGIDVWMDKNDIIAGKKWNSAIQEGLDTSDLLLLIMSPEAINSHNVEDEWTYFYTHQRPIVPILYRLVDLPYQLERIQYIDFYNQNYDSAFEQLQAHLIHYITLETVTSNEEIAESSFKDGNITAFDTTYPDLDLINRIKIAPNKKWMDNYFNLIKTVIEETGLTNDDPRLALTMPRSSTNVLPVNINNRYVLDAVNTKDGWCIDLICSKQLRNRSKLHNGWVYNFKALPKEIRNGQEPPILVTLTTFNIPSELVKDWKHHLVLEAGQAKGSPFRKFHHPSIYQAAVDLNYRCELLNDAFAHESK